MCNIRILSLSCSVLWFSCSLLIYFPWLQSSLSFPLLFIPFFICFSPSYSCLFFHFCSPYSSLSLIIFFIFLISFFFNFFSSVSFFLFRVICDYSFFFHSSCFPLHPSFLSFLLPFFFLFIYFSLLFPSLCFLIHILPPYSSLFFFIFFPFLHFFPYPLFPLSFLLSFLLFLLVPPLPNDL